MKKVSGSEIESINDSFQEEYVKLTKLLFIGNEVREVEEKQIKVNVDKCIIELKRFNKLTILK